MFLWLHSIENFYWIERKLHRSTSLISPLERLTPIIFHEFTRNPQSHVPSGPSPSRRLEIERPPTRSGSKPSQGKKPTTNDNLFDDDDSDVLGGMGFDDSPKTTKKATQRSSEDIGKVSVVPSNHLHCMIGLPRSWKNLGISRKVMEFWIKWERVIELLKLEQKVVDFDQKSFSKSKRFMCQLVLPIAELARIAELAWAGSAPELAHKYSKIARASLG